MVQELVRGLWQAPILQLESRCGAGRRVAEFLPRIVAGGMYRGAGRGNYFRISTKSTIYY